MKWFYDLSIRTKLLGAFAAFVLLMLLIGTVGIVNTSALSTVATHDLVHEIEHQRMLSRVDVGFQSMRAELFALSSARTEESVAEYIQRSNDIEAVFASDLDTLRINLTTGEDKTVFSDMEVSIERFNRLYDRLIDLMSERQYAAAQALVSSEITHETTALQEQLTRLRSISDADARSVVAHAHSLSGTALYMIIGIVGLTIPAAIFLGLFIATSISKPLVRLIHSIDSADLNTTFQNARQDEVGQLMRSFETFTGTIRQTLLGVAEAAAAVASASSQISASTEEMAAGAQQQSAQSTDVSSAVEEMSKTIYENSRNAGKTADAAAQAKQAASAGGHVVQQTVGGMRRIASVVQQSADTVRALGRSSEQIGAIISVIDDIADQTNLLALNAAIEAARAGEQGRGFAVVADEVRRLAERTTTATKEIADTIRRIQGETADAVTSMEVGTKEVDEGIQMADKAGHSLQSIVDLSQRVTDMVTQMATASEQQAGASEEISKSVEGISSVTQETATGIQQIARTAEDLNRLTEEMQRMIGRFMLSEDRVAVGAQRTGVRTASPMMTGTLAVRENGRLVTTVASGRGG
ncbi:MAG: methyl-accepting chemotaxis protein [Bacteroidetes bacterium]|jgi:methyl-accepting chemotaxis protein|nr:methyl-accepting chemotaxis protein [Bacteroidota bacterium]